MKLIVDSNIVFSALINPKSKIAELIFDINNQLELYAPCLLLNEIENHQTKILKYTNLNIENFKVIKTTVLSNIQLISEELISIENRKSAFEITKDVDENDTPFIALAMDLNTKLWTGDKKLVKGIYKKILILQYQQKS